MQQKLLKILLKFQYLQNQFQLLPRGQIQAEGPHTSKHE